MQRDSKLLSWSEEIMKDSVRDKAWPTLCVDRGGHSHVLGACLLSQVAHLGAMMPGEVDELIEDQAEVYGWVSLALCLSRLRQE